MIYTFEYPHKVGTVCGLGCQVCDAHQPALENPYMTDHHGNKMPLQPVFILREATYEEQVAEMRADGSTAAVLPGKYYYDISTD